MLVLKLSWCELDKHERQYWFSLVVPKVDSKNKDIDYLFVSALPHVAFLSLMSLR